MSKQPLTEWEQSIKRIAEKRRFISPAQLAMSGVPRAITPLQNKKKETEMKQDPPFVEQKKLEPALKFDSGKPAFELLDEEAFADVDWFERGNIYRVHELMASWLRGADVGALMDALAVCAGLLCDTSAEQAMRLEVARVLEWGARKYEAHNWRKGMSWSRVYGAAMRHIEAFARGEVINHEEHNGQHFYCHHLGSAGCCLMFLITYQREGLGTDDRYNGPGAP